MLQCIVNITLRQGTPYGTTPRNETFTLDFCHSFEVYSTWKNLSDTATVEIPKNVYVKDSNNKDIMWGDFTTPDKQKGYINAGGFINDNPQVSSIPLIMRGDAITIYAGYSYISQVNPDGSLAYATQTFEVFSGFVSSLESKSTLKIHCEDNMWLLKQTAMQPKTYTSPNNDISNVLSDIIANVNGVFPNANLTYNTSGFSLCIDGLCTGTETAAETLNKLKMILPSMAFYFNGNVLRGGGIVYYPQDQSVGTDSDGKPLYNSFNFQKNIISSDLHYSQKVDVKVAALCYSVNSNAGTTTNKMGGTQYFTSRLQLTVGDAAPSDTTASNYEYYKFYFKDIADGNTLTEKGQTYLNRYQYDGFRGRFKTFGMPFTRHGNIIYLSDNLMPERNGHYMAKEVHYSFSIDSGLRQDIELHFRTDGLSSEQLGEGM